MYILLCSIRLLRGAPAGTGRAKPQTSNYCTEYDRTNENIIAPNSLLALAKRVPMIGLATSKSQMAPPGPRTREKRDSSRDHREIHCDTITSSLARSSRDHDEMIARSLSGARARDVLEAAAVAVVAPARRAEELARHRQLRAWSGLGLGVYPQP